MKRNALVQIVVLAALLLALGAMVYVTRARNATRDRQRHEHDIARCQAAFNMIPEATAFFVSPLCVDPVYLNEQEKSQLRDVLRKGHVQRAFGKGSDGMEHISLFMYPDTFVVSPCYCYLTTPPHDWAFYRIGTVIYENTDMIALAEALRQRARAVQQSKERGAFEQKRGN